MVDEVLPAPMESKKPWQSKSIMVNAVMGVCLALCAFVPQLKSVADWVQANAVTIGVVWSVLGMVLRAVSKDKIVLMD